VAFFGALQINGTGQFFVAIERTAGDARDFFVVDDSLAILGHGDHSPDERDVVRLPFSRLARLLRRGSQKAVHTAHVMARWLVQRVSLYLNFVAPTQINAAVRFFATVEFHVQLEVFELSLIHQFRAIPRRYQVSVFYFPERRGGAWIQHPPSREIFSVE